MECSYELDKKLQTDNNSISKARLMSMHRRMHGLSTTFSNKIITSTYRFRAQDKWTDPEQTKR